MTYSVQKNENLDELCISVINMTHLKDAMKFEYTDRKFWNFAWVVKSNFKNFGLIEFKIKFHIEWYAYHAHSNSRICNIEDVLKIEHTQLL